MALRDLFFSSENKITKLLIREFHLLNTDLDGVQT